jgi:hypothetical protein
MIAIPSSSETDENISSKITIKNEKHQGNNRK